MTHEEIERAWLNLSRARDDVLRARARVDRMREAILKSNTESEVFHFTIPGRVKSAANLREHHFAKADRVKKDRTKAMQLCPQWTEGPVLEVVLFRYGARLLDSDNLASAMKGHRDGIASRLRIDDGSPLVRWDYQQATCPFGEERLEVAVRRVNDGVEGRIRGAATPASYRPRKPE